LSRDSDENVLHAKVAAIIGFPPIRTIHTSGCATWGDVHEMSSVMPLNSWPEEEILTDTMCSSRHEKNDCWIADAEPTGGPHTTAQPSRQVTESAIWFDPWHQL